MAKTGLLDEIDTKLVSVIIPIYNVEKYLDRCVQSVVKQTYKNLEIILVDDGSPDNCPELCDEWKKADSRIKVIHKKNGGLSDARNAGLDIATGEYIAFVDSDDYVHPQYIEILYYIAKKEDADVVSCEFKKVSQDEETHECYEEIRKDDINIKEYTEITDKVIGVVAWNKLYKRGLFEKIRFPIGRLHEDNGIWWKVVFYAKKIVPTSEKLYYYIDNPMSIMRQNFSIKHLDLGEVLYDEYLYFTELCEKEYASNALRDCLNSYPWLWFRLKKSGNYNKENRHLLKNKYKEKMSVGLRDNGISVKTKVRHVCYYYIPNVIFRVEWFIKKIKH